MIKNIYGGCMDSIFRIFMIVVCITGLTVAVPTLNISGTVTKTGGGPLKGVKVSLVKISGVSTTTDSLGKFNFTPVRALQIASPQVSPLEFSLKGKTLAFTLASGKKNGSIEIFSGNGRKTASVSLPNIQPGKQSLMLPEFNPGLSIVRLTIDNKTYSCPIVRLGNELFLKSENSNAIAEVNFSLAKLADAAINDTLVATKKDFWDKRTHISSYGLSDVAITMDTLTDTNTTIILDTSTCIGISSLVDSAFILATAIYTDTIRKDADLKKVGTTYGMTVLDAHKYQLFACFFDSDNKAVFFGDTIITTGKKIQNIYTLPIRRINDGLIGHYLLNGNAVDSSGCENHGIESVVNPIKNRNGTDSMAMYFDGNNARIEIPDCGVFDNSIRSELTVAAWIKPDSDHINGAIVNKTYTPGSWSFKVVGGYPMLQVNYPGGGSDGTSYEVKGKSKIDSIVWTHLIGIYDGKSGDLRIYINGILDNKVALPKGELQRSTMNVHIGYHPTWDAFKGTIDDVRIYSRIVSEDEIKTISAK
jgi:hypothetical protein